MANAADMYSSAGDPDLASLSNTTKQLTMCPVHNNPKEYFHFDSRQTMCSQCLIDKGIDRKQCQDARTYCQKIM